MAISWWWSSLSSVLEHAEGLSPAIIDGVERIIVVSDDGNRKAGRNARNLLRGPAELQIGH